MGFLIGTNSTGQGLTELVLANLAKLELSIKHCRGQGYDNGSNMKGKNIGTQTRIRAIEPRAFFVPCASHSLNLVVNDAVRINLETVKFFDIIQKVYNLFSKSTQRWAIYKRNVSGLTVKPLSETRWESRIDALKPFKHQLGEINEALIECGDEGDLETKATAKSLSTRFARFLPNDHRVRTFCTSCRTLDMISVRGWYHSVCNRRSLTVLVDVNCAGTGATVDYADLLGRQLDRTAHLSEFVKSRVFLCYEPLACFLAAYADDYLVREKCIVHRT